MSISKIVSRMQQNDKLIAESKAKFASNCILGLVIAISPKTSLAGECDRVSDLESYTTNGFTPKGAICETYVGLEGIIGVSCHWDFPFRDAEASRAFTEIWNELTRCKDGIQTQHGVSVNHPDSYVLSELLTSGGLYRIAKKDKAKIKRTLVFLSLETDN